MPARRKKAGDTEVPPSSDFEAVSIKRASGCPDALSVSPVVNQPESMLLAVVQGAAAGAAHMLGQAAGLQHGDDLVFAVRAVHAGGITQGDKAFIAWSHTGRGFEIHCAALVAGDSALWCSGGGLAGAEQRGEAEHGGEEQCFRRMCFRLRWFWFRGRLPFMNDQHRAPPYPLNKTIAAYYRAILAQFRRRSASSSLSICRAR